jgi:hypothetical protein
MTTVGMQGAEQAEEGLSASHSPEKELADQKFASKEIATIHTGA